MKSSSANDKAINRTIFVLLILILIGALLLRVYDIGYQSYWLDELFSITLADPRIDFVEMLRRLQYEVNPPLFYILLHWWSEIFGTGEVAARSLSALFGCSTVLFAAVYYRRFTDGWTHLTFVALVATSYGATWYAQEARAYSLLLLLSTMLTGATLSILTDANVHRRVNAGAVILLVGASVAAALVHYFGLVISAACYLTVLIFLWRWTYLVRLIAMGGLICLGVFAIWLSTHYQLIGELTGGNFWITRDYGQIFSTLLLLMFGNFWGIYGIAMAFLIYMCAKLGKGDPIAFDLRPLLMIIVFCLLGPAVVSLHSPVITPRNLIIVFPAAYLVVAHVLNSIAVAGGADGGWRVMRISSVVMLVGVMMMPSIESKTMPLKEQWREAAAFILGDPACRGATLFVAGSEDIALFEFYTNQMYADVEMTFFPLPAAGPIPETQVRRVVDDRCPVLLWQVHSPALPGSLSALYERVPQSAVAVERFYGSNVYTYRR
ncbi:MAG: hypothetical protein V3R98_08435 [Alphaproteobacteria bacterium]